MLYIHTYLWLKSIGVLRLHLPSGRDAGATHGGEEGDEYSRDEVSPRPRSWLPQELSSGKPVVCVFHILYSKPRILGFPSLAAP